jgi:hypothetical protein
MTAKGIVMLGALAASSLLWCVPAFATAPEEPVTKPATAITTTTATLNGELNPKTEETTGYFFAYNTNGGCSEGPTTEPGAEAKGEAIEIATPLTGLEPSREYTFCVVATHTPEGEPTESTFGGPLTFTTLAAAPTIDSESVPVVTPFEATLAAEVNPNNQTTSYAFEYSTQATGETLEGAVTTLEGAEPLPAEFGERTASVPTGRVLEPSTVYFYRVVTTNATGTTTGKVEQFTTKTAEKPIVISESFSGLTSTDAALQASVNPNYQETSYLFEYASSEATLLEGNGTKAAGAPPAPLLTAVFEEQLAGPVGLGGVLTPRTIYYYRVVAENEASQKEGTPADGPVQSFQTLAKPALSTGTAEEVTRTTARLSGTVDPGGVPTTYHLAYVAAAEYEPLAANPYANGRTTPESASIGSDYTAHATTPLEISELTPGVRYHYALIATNEIGTETGPDGTFTTDPPTPPLLQTGGASAIGPNTATITGTVNGRGLQSTYGFEVGTTAGNYGPPTGLGNTAAETPIAFTLTGLLPGTTYHYRISATNVDGTSYGTDQTFTTGASANALATAPLPFLTVPPISFPTEPAITATHTLTRAQKLSKALQACKHRPRRKRASCKRQAQRRYGPLKKKGKK